ncbi:hypothetical protein [Burkholderia ubonensis]|uniref:hypothetical protein n=1 Tax=Burkholderia ubonensis TaxID=101571 RepID=UPI000AC5D985|nr:hypothetical protein [Burkholderia ubonensis]
MKNEQTAPTYLFATIGALTERGGRVTEATGSLAIVGLAVARVGDVVTYEDGSEALLRTVLAITRFPATSRLH